MKKRLADEFKAKQVERNIKRWNIHACGMCGYECGFLFRTGWIGYDRGCNCTNGGDIEERTWEDVAAHYNLQIDSYQRETNPLVIKMINGTINEMNTFWGFLDESPTDAMKTPDLN